MTQSRSQSTVKLSVALVVLLLIGVGSYSAYRSKITERSAKAADQYFLATEELRMESEALAKEKGLKDRTELSGPLPDLDSRFAKSLKAYEAVVKDCRGTKEAYLAALEMARLYVNHGASADTASAMKWFDRAAESASDSIEKTTIALGKGYAELSAKNSPEARKRFEEALLMGGADSQKADALIGMARASRETKNMEAAKASLQRLIKEYPQAPQARIAEALETDWK